MMKVDYENGGFVIKDSGARAEFESGMVRDTDEEKIDFSNLFVHFEPMGTRLAQHLTIGRKKYPDPKPGVPNWTLAQGEEELQRFLESADRHYKQWRMGMTDEDHAAAVMFNINGAEYVRERMRNDKEKSAYIDERRHRREEIYGSGAVPLLTAPRPIPVEGFDAC